MVVVQAELTNDADWRDCIWMDLEHAAAKRGRSGSAMLTLPLVVHLDEGSWRVAFLRGTMVNADGRQFGKPYVSGKSGKVNALRLS